MGLKVTYELDGREYSGEVMTIEAATIQRYGNGLAISVSFVSPGSGQGTGGYGADGDTLVRWVRGVTTVVGVEEWERLPGNKVVVLRDKPYGQILGIANLDDDGKTFFFAVEQTA